MTTTESSLAKGLEGQFGNIGEGKLSRFGPVKSKNIGHDEVVGGVPALIGEHMKIEGLLADDGQDFAPSTSGSFEGTLDAGHTVAGVEEDRICRHSFGAIALAKSKVVDPLRQVF